MKSIAKKVMKLGGSPSLDVMGGDSCSKGHEFESWHHTYTGWTFFTYVFVVKFVMYLKRRK